LVRSLLARRRETVRPFATDACVPGDDPAGRDVTHRDLLSIGTRDVLENAITVEKGVPEMITYNHTVVADAAQLRVAVHHLPVVQRSKAAIAINESVINSAAIPGIHVYADNDTVIVEGSRKGLYRAGEIRDGKERSVASALKDVLPVSVGVATQKSVQVVYPYYSRAVVRGLRMDDQGCGRSVQVRGMQDPQCVHVATDGVPENVSITEPTVLRIGWLPYVILPFE
jgi:hypothetical protein